MCRKLVQTCLALVLGGSAALGCHATSERHLYSDDPLLLSKKSVDGNSIKNGKVDVVAQELIVDAEPAPPPRPLVALAVAPRTSSDSTARVPATTASASRSSAPTQVIASDKPTFTAVPAVRSPVTKEVPAQLAVRHAVSGTYGNAPDYTWLQGVFDKHYRGHWSLRYCDHAVDDPWGGKVILDDDPRLTQFGDGDILQIEGELIPNHPQAGQEGWDHFPHYHVRSVRLVRHGH